MQWSRFGFALMIMVGFVGGFSRCGGCGSLNETTVTATGRLLFDDGSIVEGATITGSIVTDDAITAARSAVIDLAQSVLVKPPRAITADLAQPSLQLAMTTKTTTDSNGAFSLDVGSAVLPVRVLVEVQYAGASLPVVTSAKWGEAEDDELDLGDIVIPNPASQEVQLSGGSGETADGAVRVSGLPAEVARLFARSYDPDDDTEAFPGEFYELASLTLNSSVFVWLEALTVDAQPVEQLTTSVTVRVRIARSQWADLRDLTADTDRIEVPIYTYDETTNMWENDGTGWLEDSVGTVLPEDAESVILDGTFAGDIFAAFATNHFSWKNVDYPHVGAWKLSRLTPNNRNNDCLSRALSMAAVIVSSAAGEEAFRRVNQEGADIGDELAAGQGPDIRDTSLEGAHGQYEGESGGSSGEIVIDADLWNNCQDGASSRQKTNTAMMMTATIVHETAHWKDDNKKFPDDDSDTDGEEGRRLEEDLFGGVVNEAGGVILSNGVPVSNETVDAWLDPAHWPTADQQISSPQLQTADPVDALEVTISLVQTTFELGEEIPVQVTYRNTSSSSVQVMNHVVLEGWPLHFNMVNQATGGRATFLGRERKLELSEDDFTTLAVGATLTQTVNLVRDSTAGTPLYQLIRSGTYQVTAVYEQLYGVAEATSNTVDVTLNTGGDVEGLVTDSTDASVLSGASIRLLDDSDLLATVTSDTDGAYTFGELPPGDFTLEVSAAGFLKTSREVTVSRGVTTTTNFSLSPLLATGELRIVLLWGEDPSDLDAHLWLPIEQPYHIFFGQRGFLDGCPFAELDVDDIDSEGPETITIHELVELGSYQYAVRNFGGGVSLTASNAQVQVFDSTGLIATFDVPTTGEGEWWNVMTIDAGTAQITEVNTLGDDPAPYENTSEGCSQSG